MNGIIINTNYIEKINYLKIHQIKNILFDEFFINYTKKHNKLIELCRFKLEFYYFNIYISFKS